MTLCAPGIWVIVALEVLILILLIKEYVKEKKTIALCMGLITLGLIVDAAVIGLGEFIPEGILTGLSRVRFVAHGVLIPLLFPICGYALKAGKRIMTIVWVATSVIMILGAMEGFATDLELASIAGVKRMLSGDGTPGWAAVITYILSFGTVIPLIICGIVAWIKQKNAYLFFAGLFMYAFSALGPATGNTDLLFFISMIGEVLMVGFFYLFVRKK